MTEVLAKFTHHLFLNKVLFEIIYRKILKLEIFNFNEISKYIVNKNIAV